MRKQQNINAITFSNALEKVFCTIKLLILIGAHKQVFDIQHKIES